MHPFDYISVTKQGEALNALTDHSSFLAGGTNLLDEMKLNVRTPHQLIDINQLPLSQIEELENGSLRIGALVRNSDLAWHPLILSRYPVLSQALLSGASPQLRNMATTAGNLLQHTRCTYYRDTSYPCNMRTPNSGCPAIPGYNRPHALLGTSDHCIATHPSDMCVALAALDATIQITSPSAAPRRSAAAGSIDVDQHDLTQRSIPLNDFYIPYGDNPSKLNTLHPHDLITSVTLPPIPYAARSHYLKVRDRASYEFALASAAVILDMDGQTIRRAHIALGGIATKPWRSPEAEQSLTNQPPTPATFAAAANAALATAKPQTHNAFKIQLAKQTLIRALTETASQ